MQILAIETSAKAASAALVADGVLKAEYFQNSGQTHSRTLLKLVQDMLQNCDTPVAALDAVACAIGPGQLYRRAHRAGSSQGPVLGRRSAAVRRLDPGGHGLRRGPGQTGSSAR